MEADQILNEESVPLAQPLNSLLYFPGCNSSFKLPLIVSCVKKLWQSVQVVVLASTCHFFKLQIARKMRRGNVTTSLRFGGARMAQWREHSPPTNVARVRFPNPTSNVVWGCWFSTLHREVFFGNSGFSSPQKPKFDLIVLIVNFCYSVPN